MVLCVSKNWILLLHFWNIIFVTCLHLTQQSRIAYHKWAAIFYFNVTKNFIPYSNIYMNSLLHVLAVLRRSFDQHFHSKMQFSDKYLPPSRNVERSERIILNYLMYLLHCQFEYNKDLNDNKASFPFIQTSSHHHFSKWFSNTLTISVPCLQI